MRYLGNQFGDRVISRRYLRGREWPPRSPDLSPLDFCLWGYLKSKVYSPRPATLNELQAIIVREVAQIDEEGNAGHEGKGSEVHMCRGRTF